MNIIQMVERIKSYLDVVASARHDWVAYENNIQTAQNQIVNDRIDAVKKLGQQKGYSFQSVQRLRDELYTLVKTNSLIAPTGDLIPVASYPTNLRFIVGVDLLIDAVRYIADPMSYNEKRNVLIDPYKKPQLTEPYRVYYIESDTGLTCYYGDSGTFTASYIDYIKIPVNVNVGVRYGIAGVFAAGTILIATEPTVYNAVSYDPGELITVVNPVFSITSGEVCVGYVNSDLPEVLHEEICKIAAGLFGKIIEDYQKGAVIENEANK